MSAIYQSKYTDKLVSASQILVEKLMEKIAKKDKKTLPIKFWELPQYTKVFVRHIVGANKLLKKYPVEVILKALEDPAANWILYFEHKKLPSICDKYASKDAVKKEEKIVAVDVMQRPRQQVNKNGLLERLD